MLQQIHQLWETRRDDVRSSSVELHQRLAGAMERESTNALQLTPRVITDAGRALKQGYDPVHGGCDVRFYISYEIRSLVLQMLAGAVFERAFSRFAEAFEMRARQVYGAPLADKVSPA